MRAPARPGRDSSPLWSVATALLATSVMSLCAWRAAHQSLTHDEALTWFVIKDHAPWGLFTYYVANHHALHSWLAWLSIEAFGFSELTLRLPALLGALLLLVGWRRYTRRLVGGGPLWLGAMAVLPLNPLVMDHLCVARGYGLALAFAVWVLLLLHGQLDAERLRARKLVPAGIALGLCLASNLTFGSFALVLGCALLLMRGLSPPAHRTTRPATPGRPTAPTAPATPTPPASPSSSAASISPATPTTCDPAVASATPGAWPPGHSRHRWRTLAESIPPLLAGLVLPAALVSGALLVGPLLHARGQSFFLGLPTLQQSLLNLTDASLAHHAVGLLGLAAPPPAWIQLIAGPGLLLLASWLVLAVLCLCRSPRQGVRHAAMLMLATLLVPIALPLLTLIGIDAGVVYPLWRTGLFWMLLFSAALVAVSGALRRRSGWMRRLALPLLLVLLLLDLQDLVQLNWTQYREWRYDADTRDIFLELEALQRQSGSKRPLSVGANGFFEPALNAYRDMWHADWLAPIARHPRPSGLHDLYIARAGFDAEFIADHLRVIDARPRSGIVLGVPRKASLEAIRPGVPAPTPDQKGTKH